MPENIGRFEILSEIGKGDFACVYKASDPDSGQTIALKVLQAQLPPEQTAALIQQVLAEAEATKVLSSHNIAVLYGAGEIDGKLCAATEYVQGKSIAGMLAQRDTFSIWDLLDVARQTCQGLDHAHTRQVVHYTLEPAKVLVTWDGTVKILGFGISSMGAYAAQASGRVPETLRYMSPEQLQGEPIDARSNLFSLGVILYEMVTSRKAFGGEDADQVRQEIAVGMPVTPAQINSKIQPGLNEVIMRALSKSPEQRYQAGLDLVQDLERCKESTQKAAAPRKMPQAEARRVDAASSEPAEDTRFAVRRASAATAGASAGGSISQGDSRFATTATMSAAVAYPETGPRSEPAPPKPLAPKSGAGPGGPNNGGTNNGGATNGNAAKRPSFSDMDALPPLKEVYAAPPPEPEPEPIPEAAPEADPRGGVYRGSFPGSNHGSAEAGKKTLPSEIAKRAVAELRKTPPKLFLYSIGGAVCVILLALGVIFSRIHSENAEDNATPPPATAPAEAQPANPTATAPASTQATPVPMTPEPQAAAPSPEVISVRPKKMKPRAAKVLPPPTSAIVPGQLSISSTPGGAQVLVDGHHNPSWLTPFDLAGLAPGQHLVSVSKAGYAMENRTIEVGSGSKSFLVVELAPLGATALISSVPTGAEVFMDGRDTGRATPAQVPVANLGSHIFTVRKDGYLEETTTTSLQAGQSFQYAPVLRALGVTEDIKVGGKLKKLFGGADTAGMGAVSVKTQPKGAQISVNRHVLDKGSPADFYLNPGNYIIDISLSGYKDVHRLITVDRSGKVVVDEVLDRQ
jgi:serine/threonine protein kinase